ncbi:hypothetical protein TorRG33x02_034490 [Trema orientale]|uniref:Retrovirus-related Pol polyprotein from transposon TNT 1-94-like beta-barrel domain-containing protein n=1 Tax=Trema orientale TaxID=63057 RepID=A0A2P5FSN1_TREOI|nr:hypothetical protein TorRG33x02_034490 [Trema orientale]
MDESFQASSSNTKGASPGATRINKVATYLATPDTVIDPSWYADSGATNHVIAELENMHLKEDYGGKDKLIVGNGKHLTITHIGYSNLSTNNSKILLHLKNILRVPQDYKKLS